MTNVPSQQEGQSIFHQTPLNADEDKLENQSEIALSCTAALKPFCFSDNFLLRQHWLDKKWARKQLNPHVTYSGYFLCSVSLILIFASKD